MIIIESDRNLTGCILSEQTDNALFGLALCGGCSNVLVSEAPDCFPWKTNPVWYNLWSATEAARINALERGWVHRLIGERYRYICPVCVERTNGAN